MVNAVPTPTPMIVSSELRQRWTPYLQSQRNGKGFINPWKPMPGPKARDVLKWKLSGKRPFPRQQKPLTLVSHPLQKFSQLAGHTRILWIGHASFFVEMDGLRLLIDPIFGRAGGVVPRLVPPALAAHELPALDAILLTHGHHDHLDIPSIRQLVAHHGKEILFVVPLGLASCLPKECKRVVEVDWWSSIELQGVQICFVPSQHWHRRYFDFNRSLWGGWVIRGSGSVYHSGDTGYFPGFKAIGEFFDGIDVACLPLGAYEPRWFMSPQHMDPAASLQAFKDLKATHFVGMHWGTFDLTDEPLDAGPKELQQLVMEQNLDPDRFHVLPHGGSLALNSDGVLSANKN